MKFSQTNLKFFLLLFLLVNTTKLFSQPVFDDSSPRLFLDYNFLESEFAVGKYINGNMRELGFIQYNKNQMPVSRPTKDRMITLRSTFIIDSSTIGKEIYLVTLPYDYACRIYFNGVTISFRGNIKNGYTNRTHTTEKNLLSHDLIKYNQVNEIAFELYPKEGEVNPFGKSFISNAKDANRYVFLRNLFGQSLIIALSICGIIFAVFFLFTYISRKDWNNLHYLFFASMNLFFIISYLNNFLAHNFANTYLIEKITRIGFPLFMYVGICFFVEYTNVFKRKRLFKAVLALFYAPAIIMVLIPKTATEVIATFNSYPLVILIIGNFIMFSIALLFYIKVRNLSAFFLLLVISLNLFAGIYDGYIFAVLKTKPFVLLTPIAVFLINLIIFVVLIVDHSKSYHLTLAKSKELKSLNDKLEVTVEERTRKIKEYTRELQMANSTKDKFFSIIAHDLKNPFNTLIGYSEILKNSFEELTEDEILENLNTIYTTSKSGYVLLDNLLQWAQTQTNQISFNPELIHLKSMVQELIENVENQSQFKDIEIVNSVATNHTVTGDVNQLKTILRNLLNNAIKFTDRNGLIQIKSEKISQNIAITVKDTGLGISEDDLKNLFKIDKIFSTPGTNRETGSGLGLILCKEFVEKHGGKISVKSTMGVGSEFIVSIPLKN
ncbi:MAG: ATP-binding protein [Bacteroidales bacterium]